MLQWKNNNGIPVFNLCQFSAALAAILPKLLRCLKSNELRCHPVWGVLFPFDVPLYGAGQSLGHIIRPDVILTPEGPKVCEFDFVPSGRGWVLASLPTEEQQGRFLQPFSNWYAGMGVHCVAYATGAVTACWEETVLFSERLTAIDGVQVQAVNVDRDPIGNRVVDRLFYRSEVQDLSCLNGHDAFTAEPYLDSKLVFALIHDSASKSLLLQFMDQEELVWLQAHCPQTYVLEDLPQVNPMLFDALTTVQASVHRPSVERNHWVIKNTDVESNTCWGSRGVVMGCKYGARQFANVVRTGEAPARKDLGRHPVLQRFVASVDFASIWDAIVHRQLSSASQHAMGKQASDVTSQLARKHVYARVGLYFLVDNVHGKVRVPPYGVLTLRQDELAHGTSDALTTAFEVT